jgi:hypothetical protein
MTIEQAVVEVMNLDGWQLQLKKQHIARGRTPKGKTCQMVLRINRENEDIIISKGDYERLKYKGGEVKLYFYATPKFNYLFWMNEVIMGEPVEIVSDSTLFANIQKGYYLEPSQAALTNKN